MSCLRFARGENPYQIREKRGSVPSLGSLGPVSGVRTHRNPLSAVLRLRNPFSSPQLKFYHGAAIGVMGYMNAAALHGQSSTDLNISAHKTQVSQSVSQSSRSPRSARVARLR